MECSPTLAGNYSEEKLNGQKKENLLEAILKEISKDLKEIKSILQEEIQESDEEA